MEKTTTTLKAMVKEANAVKGAKFTDTTIPSAILEKLTEENTKLFDGACKVLASKSKKAFFESFFMVKVVSGLEEKDTEKAIKESVSCKQYGIEITDSGLLKVTDKLKAISFSDVLNAKIKLLAFKHSDNKATKEDRINAVRFYFDDYGKGYLDILTHNARQYMSIGNCDDTKEVYNTNANFEKAIDMLDAKYKKLEKENPFRLNSNNALTLQIADTIAYFVENADTKLFSYHCKAVFQMVCNRNKYGKLTIASANDVINALAIVYRYASNGYKLPTTDKSDIYKTIK